MAKVRREFVIGLSVIGSLLLTLGFVVYKKVTFRRDPPEALASRAMLPIAAPEADPAASNPADGAVAPDAAATADGADPLRAARRSSWNAPLRSTADAPAADYASDPSDTATDGNAYAPAAGAAAELASPPGNILTSAEQPYADPAQESGDPNYDTAAADNGAAGNPLRAGAASASAGGYAQDAPGTPNDAGAPAAADSNWGRRGWASPDQHTAAADPASGSPNTLPDDMTGQATPDAVPTSGEMAVDGETPRAGFRTRFADSAGQSSGQGGYDTAGQGGYDAAGQGGYDAAGQQPRALHGEGRGHAHHEPTPVGAENGKYVVQPNDNYWVVSQKVYGEGGYFKALYEHNRLRYPRQDKLAVGDVLDTPAASVLAERYPELCPKQRKVPPSRSTLMPASTRHRMGERVYVVTEGDTLFDIAKFELGKATRWNEIYELNRDVLGEDFDYLRPGTELVLPRGARETDSVTRSPDPNFQR